MALPLRILIVTQYFWPENFRVNDLVAELAARGHEVTVLTGIPNYPGGKTFEEFDRESGDQFSIYRCSGHPNSHAATRAGKPRLILNYLSFVLSGLTVGAWKLRGRRLTQFSSS